LARILPDTPEKKVKKSENKACNSQNFLVNYLSVSERKNNMKNEMKKTVKVMGPWVDGVRTVKEISLDEWNSYTPLNRRVKGEWFKVVKW